MILTDNETKVDLLNNEAIAVTIIGLLRAKPDHPVTIGVHGELAGVMPQAERVHYLCSRLFDVCCKYSVALMPKAMQDRC